ncbi:glycine cleavage system aminomethyltransferase T/glycine/D-amino acid oxidase-like deaminating enzyme [Actinoplanes tereljensis]|uniref:Sarcosine dehydrogenase n=1 Tax=Paractinoplanes tereljensis TaxID=571912 RepID=A0A919NH54_9ACTN|nr:FAD-dependent oxidoreductase [Actinoplanes tereljensis]GIF18103.1 sarcosine dehydrogenase [Actinoplanes tereljensis]
MPGPKVVIIGAGIVGCALADELTARGWTEVTVLERGPLFVTGGSSSHAPGLVFQTNPSRTMARMAQYTVQKLAELDCFRSVGSLEVATTPERLAELHRRFGYGQSWGIGSAIVDPAECARLFPLLGKEEPSKVLGGLHVPTDGLALAVKACEFQAGRAVARGARFVGGAEVVEILQMGGRVVGARTTGGDYPAEIVVSCAGFWGPRIGELAGVPIPLLPMAHQYVHTGPVGAADDLPIVRHQDRDLYFRAHGDTLGIGSYLHEPMPVDLDDLPGGAHPSMMAFTPDTFAESWQAAGDLLPVLRATERTDGFNGVFSFTADGFPLLGESRELQGFWTAEAIWVTHSAGAAKAVAEWMVTGRPETDLHECDLNRFDPAQLAPAYVKERAIRSFVEVYDIIHPLDPPSVRELRVSPFYERQKELGAVFGEAAGWERPLWYAANPPQETSRDAWSARHWSSIAGTEARLTRENVALYDMTPLTRLHIEGPVDFLQGLTSGNVDRPVGTVIYTLLLDQAGGIRSDITVARLGEHRFQVGVNGPLDLDWLLRQAPANVTVRDITGGTCGVGLWGPKAREVVENLTDIDVTNQAFKYFQCREGFVGSVPVSMLRLSYVGELGWEIYTRADYGRQLWDTLWEAGRDHGLIAAGRHAFTSLRLEKGYRAWGVDMTTEDDPWQAGLGFAVSGDKREPADRKLTCLVLADPDAVPLGREPVYLDGQPVGHVTSAAFGHTIGAPIAYAWLPVNEPGTEVEIGYFDRRLRATVTAEPLFDPKHERLRR